jgi:uncharacterized cupredoxin-like copper-binding protein
MKPRYLVAPAALVLGAAALAPMAVGSSHPAAHAAKTRVSVTAKEFSFALKPATARHGSVTFTVKNVGKIQHDFKIVGKATPKINPKKSAKLTVSLKKGTYRYICTLPGHAASGMKGSLRVS